MCKKEPHQFGSDLLFGPAWRPRKWDRYLTAFAGAGDAPRVGESSAGYLYSARAAEEIKAFRPDAQIIVMLRNPIEVVHALHASLLYVGDEDIEDIEEALAAEPDRRQGRRIPSTNELAFALCYRAMVRFSSQLARYVEAFGWDRLHVIVFDDFRDDTAAAYRATLEFLDVEPDFEPDFEIANANHRARIPALATLHSKAYLPPTGSWALIRRAAHIALPSQRARARIHRQIVRANTVYEPRPPLPAALRARLEAEFADEVRELGELIDRDLSHWVRGCEGEPTRSYAWRGASTRRPCSRRIAAARAIALERHRGSVRDLEQVVVSVGLVEDPEHRQLRLLPVRSAADRVVEPALSELRLAVRVRVQVGAVLLQSVEQPQALGERIRERLGAHELEVVGRGVVLGETAVRGAHQTAHRQVEAGRAVLALVVAPGAEVLDLVVLARVAQHLRHRPVDLRVAAPASLVGRACRRRRRRSGPGRA